MSDQLKDLHFLATRLQSMAADGHGYFAQNDIARMIRTADAMFAADARIAALEETLSSIALDCQGASVCGEPEMGLETIYHKASEALAAREVAK